MINFIPLILCDVIKKTTKQKDRKFLIRCHQLVAENINNEKFDTVCFCKELGLSGTQLSRRMKFLTGRSPSQFIRRQKLKNAAHLILFNELSVSEAAYQSGFNSMSYFSKCFKDEYGMLPSKY